MAELPLVILLGPPLEYLDLTALVQWLGVTQGEVRALIDQHRIPRPEKRRGRNRPVWTREEAVHVKWIVDNLTRFGSQISPSES